MACGDVARKFSPRGGHPREAPADPPPKPTLYAGIARISSAADLQALAGVELVSGDLEFRGTNLTDLSPLSSLKQIGGQLRIAENDQLESLHGLESLQLVGDDVSIHGNGKLSSIAALAALERIGGGFQLSEGQVVDLKALAGLVWIGGSVDLEYNFELRSIDGLRAQIGGDLAIMSNPALTSLGGTSLQNGPISLGGGIIISDNKTRRGERGATQAERRFKLVISGCTARMGGPQ